MSRAKFPDLAALGDPDADKPVRAFVVLPCRDTWIVAMCDEWSHDGYPIASTELPYDPETRAEMERAYAAVCELTGEVGA